MIEQCLTGEELSFIALVGGGQLLPLASSRDHKRVGDGDTGPNTGGMGAISPAPQYNEALGQRILDEVMLPAVRGLAAERIPYTGFLYAGLMIGADGVPRVLEFNCRLGDPETQVILPRLRTDLYALCRAALAGELGRQAVQWRPQTAIGVVLAAAGLPRCAPQWRCDHAATRAACRHPAVPRRHQQRQWPLADSGRPRPLRHGAGRQSRHRPPARLCAVRCHRLRGPIPPARHRRRDAMTTRRRSSADRAIGELDQALRTLFPPAAGRAARATPEASGGTAADAALDTAERRLAAGLMRVNHSGEVCAQALYRGQATTSPSQRRALLRAALDEGDHLAWCERRLVALHSATRPPEPHLVRAVLGHGRSGRMPSKDARPRLYRRHRRAGVRASARTSAPTAPQ